MVKRDTAKLDAILRNLGKNKSIATEQIANGVVDIAKDNAPVLSGALRDSIHVESDGDDHAVVVGVDYGAFVEFGTSRMAAQPYLGPAVAKVRKKLAKYFKKVVTNA